MLSEKLNNNDLSICTHTRQGAFVAFRYAGFTEGFAEGDYIKVEIVHEFGWTDFCHSSLDFERGGFVGEPSKAREDAFDVRINREIGRSAREE